MTLAFAFPLLESIDYFWCMREIRHALIKSKTQHAETDVQARCMVGIYIVLHCRAPYESPELS